MGPTEEQVAALQNSNSFADNQRASSNSRNTIAKNGQNITTGGAAKNISDVGLEGSSFQKGHPEIMAKRTAKFMAHNPTKSQGGSGNLVPGILNSNPASKHKVAMSTDLS